MGVHRWRTDLSPYRVPIPPHTHLRVQQRFDGLCQQPRQQRPQRAQALHSCVQAGGVAVPATPRGKALVQGGQHGGRGLGAQRGAQRTEGLGGGAGRCSSCQLPLKGHAASFSCAQAVVESSSWQVWRRAGLIHLPAACCSRRPLIHPQASGQPQQAQQAQRADLVGAGGCMPRAGATRPAQRLSTPAPCRRGSASPHQAH